MVGELHPALLAGAWGVFELDLDVLLEAAREPVYEDVISYPPAREDLAFAVARGGERRRARRGSARSRRPRAA